MKDGNCLNINSLIIYVTLFLALLLTMSGLEFHTALAFHPSPSSSTLSPTSNPPTPPPSNQVTTPQTAGCGPGTDNSTCNQTSNSSQSSTTSGPSVGCGPGTDNSTCNQSSNPSQQPPIGGATTTPNNTGGGFSGGSPYQSPTAGAGASNGNGFGSGSSSSGGEDNNQGGFGNTNGPPYPSSGPSSGGGQTNGSSGFGSGPSSAGQGPSTPSGGNNNNGGSENGGGSGYGNQPPQATLGSSGSLMVFNIPDLDIRLLAPSYLHTSEQCTTSTHHCIVSFRYSDNKIFGQVRNDDMGTPLNEEKKSEMDFSGFSGVSDVKSTKTVLNGRPTYIITWETEDDPGTSHQNMEALIGNSDNSLWLVIVLHISNRGDPTAQTVLNSIEPLESSNLNNGQSLPSNVGEQPSPGESSNNNQQPGENSGNNNNQPPTEGGGGGANNQPQPPIIPHF